tara:strand:+ start:179 stop:862 length:684 start_codon:yes stop_codon:yes gene_type:complete
MIERLNALLDQDLTPKHREVVDSFRKNLLKWGSLSERQVNYFDSIAANYTAEKLQERASYARRLRTDEDYRERVRVVAEYYQRTGYYRGAASDTMAYLRQPDKGLVSPPKFEDVEKMINNKYAQNILESHFSEPKYAVGEMVQIRSRPSKDNVKGAGSRKYLYGITDQQHTFLVIKVDSSPINRSLTYDDKKGGTRWYELLPLGSTETIEVIEKELKRPTAKLLRGE